MRHNNPPEVVPVTQVVPLPAPPPPCFSEGCPPGPGCTRNGFKSEFATCQPHEIAPVCVSKHTSQPRQPLPTEKTKQKKTNMPIRPLLTHPCCGDRAAGGRALPPQVFSPPGPTRQQHPASYRSPAAPVTLPPPRLRPAPGAPVPEVGGGEYAPRGRRGQPASQADRPRCVHARLNLVQKLKRSSNLLSMLQLFA